jgi:hypothetical protein
MIHRKPLLLCSVLLVVASLAVADEPVGKRPYEMVWVNRTDDTHPPLVDFENLDGWTVQCNDTVADLKRSREQQLWGSYVAKLTYRGTGPKATVTVKPPKPIPLPASFDCINFWVYGNNWAWVSDKGTPQVAITVVLRAKDGRELPVSMTNVRWREWWVMHQRLSPEQLASLGSGGTLEGIRVTNCRNKEDRVLYFDNLAVYKEQLPPLSFEPRPERGIKPFAGQTTGTNTGPGKLPFPTREETILPDNLTQQFTTQLEPAGDGFRFRYRGQDGQLVYTYKPSSGTLGDVTAQWDGAAAFQPMADGGIRFASDDNKPLVPEKIVKLDCRQEGDTVVSTWRSTLGSRSAEVTYTLRLWQKSLVVDVKCLGGQVGEVWVGKAVGVTNPRLVTLPYLACEMQRPAVLVTGPVDKSLFTTAFVDHCRSNASSLWAVNQIVDQGVSYNGGSRYLPKTDGQRNDCFERLFLTVSPRFEEVLPNIPNPKSPWMHVAGERVWRAHGASNREQDYAIWKQVARYGMSKVLITDHETGWRDGGESFTMRTRAAPGRGGDESQVEYSRKMRALGFRYGIYNNYTDYAPVNEHWSEDYVTRLSNGQWQSAWARCYNPKPARAVELEARLAPIIQQKFQLDTAYCDVHTAVQPWRYVDFDARVPGAGTFAATFYAYGEIMLHQKKTWNGPVYSEGNNHWYYCGLTDGNYGQDQAARLAENPWLVDFDMRKMHPLCCNFGMGNIGMFYGHRETLGDTPEEQETRLDRFLAATLAFGHTGFLVMEGGISNGVRSYFSVQQIHANYAQETAVDIRYADEQGRLHPTSAAVANDAFKRSQVFTQYSNGLKVAVNGHPTETWKLQTAELPPNGWLAKDAEGKLTGFSAIVDGHRADYVDSPAYVYANGRGRFTRFAKAACDGQLVANKRADGSVELIPVGKCTAFAISLDGRTATAVALAEDGKELGPAETRLSRGLVHVVPVAGALSYVLKPGDRPTLSLKCDREKGIPGETIAVVGGSQHTFRIPADAAPGARVWQKFEDAWIDVTVVPMVDARLELKDSLRLELTPHVAAPLDAEVKLGAQAKTVKLVSETPVTLDFAFDRPKEELVREIKLTVDAGDLHHRQSWWLKAEESILAIADFPNDVEKGQRLRKGKEIPLDEQTHAHVVWGARTCGEVTKPSLFMHPPYQGGTGYVFAITPPVQLPAEPKAALRCQVGKADGSDTGDGILFRIAVVDSKGKETIVAEKPWLQHAWTPLEADLSPWAGQRVRLKLISDVGPKDNSSGDWASWAEMRLESLRPTLQPTLHDKPVELRHRPGPFPLKNVRLDDLRKAKSAVLHFQGIGLGSSGQYTSYANLNKVRLGTMPSAGGAETKGVWADAKLALKPEAIATLSEQNTLTIDNPGGDSFAVRAFWIELELADGRKCSSQIATTAYRQPPQWPYGYGEGVPADQDIQVQLRFRLP